MLVYSVFAFVTMQTLKNALKINIVSILNQSKVCIQSSTHVIIYTYGNKNTSEM